MNLSAYLEKPVIVSKLHVAANGGDVIELTTEDGLSLFLAGYGNAARDGARRLASDLHRIADSIVDVPAQLENVEVVPEKVMF